MKVKTLNDAYRYVQQVKICTIFSDKAKGIPSLWDAVDLPERSGGKTKWGAKVEAVWAWKTELPTEYPDDIFYGKIKGGHAALIAMDYFRSTYYPSNSKGLETCSDLAQKIYELVRLEVGTTGQLRSEAKERFVCSKGRFDTALKQLQVTLNIVRLNEPHLKNDTWAPFKEVYLDMVDD